MSGATGFIKWFQAARQGMRYFLIGESGSGPYGEAALIIVAVLLVAAIFTALGPALGSAMSNLAKVIQQQ